MPLSVLYQSPNMLLADHSLSPFLESYRTPQTSLWGGGVLAPGTWLVPRASSFLPRNCLTSPPFGPSGARTAPPVSAVLGTSLGEAISLIPGGERLALEASSIAELGLGARPLIPSWLKDKADVREHADASSPVSLSCMGASGASSRAVCNLPEARQMCPKVVPAHRPPGRGVHRGDGPTAN